MSQLLSDKDRMVFGNYCQRQAQDIGKLIEQMEKTGIPEAAVRKYKQRGAAFAIVAEELLSAESFSVGGDS